jgi:hypothetical protein
MSEETNFDWDKELSSLTKELGHLNFSKEADFRAAILEAGETLGVTERTYTKEQNEFLESHAKTLRGYARKWFMERGTNLNDAKEMWFGNFLFTMFAYEDYYASVSFFPSRNDTIAVVSYNQKEIRESPFTNHLVEIWTTVETVKYSLEEPVLNE